MLRFQDPVAHARCVADFIMEHDVIAWTNVTHVGEWTRKGETTLVIFQYNGLKNDNPGQEDEAIGPRPAMMGWRLDRGAWNLDGLF